MKKTNNTKTTQTMPEMIREIEKAGVNGSLFFVTTHKFTNFVNLITITNGEMKFFVCQCTKPGTRKRNKGDKVARFNDALICDSMIREVTKEDMLKHVFIGIVPQAMVISKCIPVFGHSALVKSRTKFDIVFNFTANKNVAVAEIEEMTAEEPAAPAEEPAAPAEEPTAPAEEPAAPKTEEDWMIDWMVDLDTKSTNPFTKGFLNRMMDVSSSIDKSLIEEVDKFDCSYRHAQEICQSLMESIKTVQNTTTAAENIDKFIFILAAMSAELKSQAEKEEITVHNLKRSLENVTENRVRYFYNGIDCRLSIIEEENNEQKKAVAKVNDIMANLSDIEKDLLMKSLGLKPEVEIVEDPVPVPELTSATIDGNKFVIIMNDGNTRSIEKTWSEIAHHLRQVALKKETVNVSVCEYVASEMAKGMSRKELGECLGSNHYATKVLDYCSQLGLYKIDKNLNPRKISPDAAAKAGKTRSTLSKIRKKAIDEDLAKHAASRG